MTNCFKKARGFFINDFVCENVQDYKCLYVCTLNGCESLPYVGHPLIEYSLGQVSFANGARP
jgi:hypothetical protein